jgi:uncharacterized protein HemX
MGKHVAEGIEEKKQKPVTVTKERNGGVWFGVVILLIVIGVAGAGYFLLQQLRDKQQDLGGEISKEMQQIMELTKQISAHQALLGAMQNQLTELNSRVVNKEEKFDRRLNEAMKRQHERFDNEVKEVNDSIQKIHRQLGKTRGDWLVSDAEYLLGVANRRLHLIGDVGTTLAALQAADQRLRESGDTAAFKIRKQIAKEILVVRDIKIVDTVGIYSTLEALEEQVNYLHLSLPYLGKVKIPDKEGGNNVNKSVAEVDVNDVLDKALVEIKGIVSVRRLDAPVKLILTPEHKVFIKERLSSKLMIVKLALLQHDDKLYQSSIDDVLQWLNKNFADDRVRVRFKRELDQLRTIQIRSNLPDIGLSFKMLKDIVKLRLEVDKVLQNENFKQVNNWSR